MAKALTGQQKLERLHDQGFTDRQLANITGWSSSSINDMRHGKQSTANADAAIREFYGMSKGARENVLSGQVPLPSAKEGGHRVTTFERARGHLSQLPSDTKVVAEIKLKDGSRRFLYQKGGIEAGKIQKGNLKAKMSSQARKQGFTVYGGPGGTGHGRPSDPEYFDWSDVAEVTFDEY